MAQTAEQYKQYVKQGPTPDFVHHAEDRTKHGRAAYEAGLPDMS